MVDAGAAVSVAAGADFEVEWTVDLVLFCAVNSCQMFGHFSGITVIIMNNRNARTPLEEEEVVMVVKLNKLGKVGVSTFNFLQLLKIWPPPFEGIVLRNQYNTIRGKWPKI